MNDKPVLRYLTDSIPWFSLLAGTDREFLKSFATYKCFGLLLIMNSSGASPGK